LDAEVGLDKPGGLVGLYNGCVVGLAPASICDTTPYFSGESLPYDNRFLTDDIDTTYATGANFSNDDSFGLSAKVSWQLSDVFSAVSITAYREVDSSFGADIDSSPAIYDQPTFAIEQSQVSQEFLLKGEFDDINFTVGAMYFTEDATQADNVAIAAGLIQIAGDNSQEVTSLSFFGEANYSITDDVTLVFGGRYTDEDKELELNQRSLNPDFFVSTGFPVEFFPRDDRTFLGPADTQRANFTNTSIRVGADWQIDEELFTYLTFSQGFKSGGFTTRLTAPFNPVIALNGLSDLGFDEETVDSFEVGFKSEFLDGRLRMNAAAFFNTYKDIQIVVQRGITPANENAGEAEIKGVELEMEAVLGEQVYLTVALGYQNAEYTELDPLLSESEFGSFDINAKLANTPELTGSVSLNWAVGYVAGGELEYNLNYSYTDDVYNDTANTEALFQKASAIMGTSLSWVSNDYTWNARLGVTNLTNKRRLDSGFDGGSLNFVGGTYNRPREVYFTVGYDY
jgi:iron complex outermembrane receptor protein